MRSAVLSSPLILDQPVCLCFGHQEIKIGVTSDLETASCVLKTFDTRQEIQNFLANFISMHYLLERACVRLGRESHRSRLKYPVFPCDSR